MKIPAIRNITSSIKSCLKTIKSYPINNNEGYANFVKKISLNTDIFKKTEYAEIILQSPNNPGDGYICKSILNSVKQFSNHNYEVLTKKELTAIRANISVDTAQTAETVVKTAQLVKQIFDDQYGEGNYVFISIGRSFSTLAKCLEYMGCETRCIPFSGASGITEKSELWEILHQTGFDKYIEYLNREGLSPEKIKKSQKDYLFCDYAQSGNSLSAFKRILTDKTVGLSSSNIHFIKLNKVLNIIADNLPAKYNSLNNQLVDMDWLLATQSFDDYSQIQYLECRHLKNVELAANHPLDDKAKKLQFCLLDILHTKK